MGKKYPARLTSPESPIPLLQRGITVQQLSDFACLVNSALTSACKSDNPGEMVTWEKVSFEEVKNAYIVPLIGPHQCSFVELVASSPQTPMWFISHWMGYSFANLIKAIIFHADCRKMSWETTYWIKPFGDVLDGGADNLVVETLRETIAGQVLASHVCVGTLLMVDQEVETFTRTWCLLEYFLTLDTSITDNPKHLIDVATVVNSNKMASGTPCAALLEMDQR